MLKKSLVLLGSLMLCLGCSHGKKFSTEGAKVSKNGFTLSAGWVKDKTKRFDAGINLSNDSKKPLLIEAGNVRYSHGDTEGSVTGIDGSMGVAAGGSNSFTLHCNLGTAVKGGAFKVELKKVYANPNGDATTKGSEVASNLVLVLQPEK